MPCRMLSRISNLILLQILLLQATLMPTWLTTSGEFWVHALLQSQSRFLPVLLYSDRVVTLISNSRIVEQTAAGN